MDLNLSSPALLGTHTLSLSLSQINTNTPNLIQTIFFYSHVCDSTVLFIERKVRVTNMTFHGSIYMLSQSS